MTYESILVAVDPCGEAWNRVQLAAHLADDFGARLLGVAAERTDYASFTVDPTSGGPFVLPMLHEVCLDRLRQAHALFDAAVSGRRYAAWRSDLADPLTFLLANAAGADLVVIGRPTEAAHGALLALDPADAVMNLGRPVLLVPASADRLAARRVAIGWKNTREARRAVSDAMPFLARAAEVVVCTAGNAGDGEGLVRHLAERGIQAVTARTGACGSGTAEALVDIACEHAADLLVTGAYGHTRMREWAFGGVTRDLIAGAPICCLMSH